MDGWNWDAEEVVPEQLPVAVYGSLRVGGGNDPLWRGTGWVKAEGRVPGLTLRYEHRGFPYAVAEADARGAKVELLDCSPEDWPTLVGQLDRLEGHPRFYCRTRSFCRVETGSLTEDPMVECWVYVVQGAGYSTMRPVPDNDWGNVVRLGMVIR
jgi:gamma-glutamylcyclotransferase (GGCT)/AIG2-like uncharacterized protein YtfP